MTFNRCIALVAVACSFMSPVSPQVSAQKAHANNHQPRSKLIDVGTFGGPRNDSTEKAFSKSI